MNNLRNAEERRCTALVAGDVEVVGSILDGDLHYVHSTGRRDTKPSLLEFLRDGTTSYLGVDHRFIHVREVGDLAVVDGAMRLRLLRDGTERHVISTTLTVWRRAGDQWLLRAFEGTAAE